jgi:hypothetical protein
MFFFLFFFRTVKPIFDRSKKFALLSAELAYVGAN